MWRSSRRRKRPAGAPGADLVAANFAFLALLAAGIFAAGGARAEVCLPPVYEDGSRLASPDDTRVMWLEPLLRQHEVCWRRPAAPGEARVFVFGSSGIFGYPHPADATAVASVNRALAAAGARAHLFNLGMLWTYAPKDALIVLESQRFRPDVLVYAVTLSDLFPHAPTGFESIDTFVGSNRRAAERAASAGIEGLSEPFRRYARYWEGDPSAAATWRSLRQLGSLLRASVRQAALGVRNSWFPEIEAETVKVDPAPATYDCNQVKEHFGAWLGWQEWSPLPWLETLGRERGMEILVVNWPVASDRTGECLNARYPARDFEEYSAWLKSETAARGLRYLDLHDLLAPADFLDSIHPTRDGQEAVARKLEAVIREILAARTGG